MYANESLFSTVDDQELMAVEGGIVTIEYLVLGTFLALALIAGVSVISAPRDTAVTSTSRSSTASR
jgi:lactobin A/cerein 7B family class IIb bacteriocin